MTHGRIVKGGVEEKKGTRSRIVKRGGKEEGKDEGKKMRRKKRPSEERSRK